MIIIVVSAITSEAPTDMKFYYQWRSNFSLKTFTSGHCKRYRVAQGRIRCGHDSMHRRPCGTYALNPVALCDTQRAVTLITKSDQIGDTQYQIGDIFWACIFSDADI